MPHVTSPAAASGTLPENPENNEQLGNPEPARAHWPTTDSSEIEMSEATRRQLHRALARLHGRSALRPASPVNQVPRALSQVNAAGTLPPPAR